MATTTASTPTTTASTPITTAQGKECFNSNSEEGKYSNSTGLGAYDGTKDKHGRKSTEEKHGPYDRERDKVELQRQFKLSDFT